MNNNLALANYVDLDNNHAKTKSVLKMIIAFVVLMVIYQLIPLITYVLHGPIIIAIYLIMAGLIAYAAHYFGNTTKVVNKPIRLGKATVSIYTVFMVLWAIILIMDKVKVFKLSPNQCAKVLLLAVFSGIIEEALFRGLLLNAFIDLFSKSKYVFMWAALLESICFGCAHLLNLSHQSFVNTLGEICITIGLGLMLSYMRFATNGILLCTIFHIYFDISPQLDGTSWGSNLVAGAFIFFIVLAAIALPAIYSYNKRFNEGIVKE